MRFALSLSTFICILSRRATSIILLSCGLPGTAS